jgi:hypothetical protein
MIDDPADALKAQNSADDRLRSPVSRLVGPFLEITKLFTPLLPGSGVMVGAAGVLNRLLDRSAKNVAELVAVLQEEMKCRGAQIAALTKESEARRKFMQDEFPGLVLDALGKAADTRAKDRIGRLARILVRAAEVGPESDADQVEEFMRVAVNLSGQDVLVLSKAVAQSAREEERGQGKEARAQVSARAWMAIGQYRLAGPTGDELASIGSKLQSFGLASRIETLTGDTPSYLILDRGRKFEVRAK